MENISEQQIIDGLTDHLTYDTGFKWFTEVNENGGLRMYSPIIFDVRNSPPSSHFANYYPVDSIEQMKRIAKEVIIHIPDDVADKMLNSAITANAVDLSKPLFFSIFRPNRL